MDVHNHIYEKDDRWAHRTQRRTADDRTTEEAHRQATLAEMKKHNVVKAITSSNYEAVLRAKAAAPVKSSRPRLMIIAGLGLLAQGYASGRLSALGEIGAQYEGIAPMIETGAVFRFGGRARHPNHDSHQAEQTGIAYDDAPMPRALSNRCCWK